MFENDFPALLQEEAPPPGINLLSPNSDRSQFSNCNIKGLSAKEVMRIENMITQVHSLNIPTAPPHYWCNGDKKGEFVI